MTHQAVVQAIQDVKREHALWPQAISRVIIRGAPRIMEERHAVRDPETVMGAQYSLPFTTAIALTRDLSNPLIYNDAAVRDPVVRDLLDKFVCVRVVHANGMDLSLFQYDYDQSWSAFFLNADRTIYGRYGTRSHETESGDDVSLEGFAKARQYDYSRSGNPTRDQLAGARPME